MNKKRVFIRLLVLVVANIVTTFIHASQPQSLRAMVINAEWLWTPNDRHVDGEKYNRGDPSLQTYNSELTFYRSLIIANNINLVALIEIENELVATELAGLLGQNWNVAFKQGRDTATGQDVALISNLVLVENSVSDFNFPEGRLSGESKGKRLSKIVGASYVWKGDRLGVITSHFLSKRNDSPKKAKNRLRQAVALAKASKIQRAQVDFQIVLGDFNDFMSSKVMRTLKKQGSLFAQAANQSGVDHILTYKLTTIDSGIVDLKRYSDHDAIWSELRP